MENVFIPFPVAVVKYHDERNSLGENVLPSSQLRVQPHTEGSIGSPQSSLESSKR